jgi:hypothetical protein
VFRVLVDDNFHYMDETERYELGVFDTLEAATQAAQALVDEGLLAALQPGLTAEQLYRHYMAMGEDPFIVPPDTRPVTFSAWAYARQRCGELCPGTAPAQ